MKVWKDLISGDEMVSDSYPHSLEYGDTCLVVKSRLLSKKANEDFGITGSKLLFFLLKLNDLTFLLNR
jgi:hypothetical protein